jgi:hypothetical protein
MKKLIKRISFRWYMWKIRFSLYNRLAAIDQFLNHSKQILPYGTALLYLVKEHDENQAR